MTGGKGTSNRAQNGDLCSNTEFQPRAPKSVTLLHFPSPLWSFSPAASPPEPRCPAAHPPIYVYDTQHNYSYTM